MCTITCRCRLSKRQRTLYEDYMASSDTSATLASSNFLGIINVLMQLRKVHLADLGLHYKLFGTQKCHFLQRNAFFAMRIQTQRCPGPLSSACYFSEMP